MGSVLKWLKALYWKTIKPNKSEFVSLDMHAETFSAICWLILGDFFDEEKLVTLDLI